MEIPGSDFHLILSDGRKLGARLYGDTSLRNPILYFHGLPGSRFEASVVDKWSRDQGITLIAPDRPGFGISSPKRGRTLLDWPKDVKHLLNELKILKYSILGVSGGAPYALSIAALYPEMVRNISVVSGVSELSELSLIREMVLYNRILLHLGQKSPRIASGFLDVLSSLVSAWPRFFFEIMKFCSCSDDARILAKPDVKELFLRNFLEATSQGSFGVIDDFLILTKPWGFNLEDIKADITIWHGEEDRHVPISMGKYTCARIPNVKERIIPGRGHLMIFDLVETIIGEAVK